MILIRIMVAAGLVLDMFGGMLAGFISGALLGMKWQPGTSILDIFSREPSYLMLFNAFGGALAGMICGVGVYVYVFRSNLFCNPSRNARQLPVMAVVWMAAGMAAASVIAFAANWIFATDQVDAYMMSNRFFFLHKWWFIIYIFCGAAAGVTNAVATFISHKFCIKKIAEKEM